MLDLFDHEYKYGEIDFYTTLWMITYYLETGQFKDNILQMFKD